MRLVTVFRTRRTSPHSWCGRCGGFRDGAKTVREEPERANHRPRDFPGLDLDHLARPAARVPEITNSRGFSCRSRPGLGEVERDARERLREPSPTVTARPSLPHHLIWQQALCLIMSCNVNLVCRLFVGYTLKGNAGVWKNNGATPGRRPAVAQKEAPLRPPRGENPRGWACLTRLGPSKRRGPTLQQNRPRPRGGVP